MSLTFSNLCSEILRQFFGDAVQAVGDCLFGANSRPLAIIMRQTKLSRREVSKALTILIHHQLVTYRASPDDSNIIEYVLKRDEIYFLLRYGRYLQIVSKKYGEAALSAVEELLQIGPLSCTEIILKCNKQSGENPKMELYRSSLLNMINDKYLIRVPCISIDSQKDELFANLQLNPYELHLAPEIDLHLVSEILAGKKSQYVAQDRNKLWFLNFKRFHQDIRDNLMIKAIEQKLGATASECFEIILKEMYQITDPWQRKHSNAFTLASIKNHIEKKTKNTHLIKHLNQYVTIIADDSFKFMRKIGHSGGGEYIVQFATAFEELALTSAESVISERFGSKAMRLFRVIRLKKYIEQDDLQKEAMMPAKEAKYLSYNLFQEQFIQIKTIRTAGGGGTGPARSFFLFQLKPKQIIKMLLDMCYKAVFNTLIRLDYEKDGFARVQDKAKKLEKVVSGLRNRGVSEEYIADLDTVITPPEQAVLDTITHKVKILMKAETVLDDMILTLQLYLYHTTQEQVW